MKLKYRLAVAMLCLIVVTTFVGLELPGMTSATSGVVHVRRIQSSGTHQTKGDGPQRHQRPADYIARSAPDRQEAPPHLAMMRKDLDVSNYTSPEVRGGGAADSKLLEYVLKDRDIRESDTLNNIVRIASLVDEFHRRSPQSPEFSDNRQAAPPAAAGATHPSLGTAQDIREAREKLRELELTAIKRRNEKAQLSKADVAYLTIILAKLKPLEMKPKKAPYLNFYKGKKLPAWRLYHNHITQFALYDPADPAVAATLTNVVRWPPVKLYQHEGGTQLKLVLSFRNGARAMWKPRRFPRDRETLPDHFYFSDYERFNSEIAAYRLDRVMGFHRVPPTAGRLLNITRDIEPLAEDKLQRTFFISPAGNACFHGKCSYYCDTGHAVCGSPYVIEGSVAAYLPSNLDVARKTWRHPWRRSYSKHRYASWESDESYCDRVAQTPPYDEGRRLVDLMDMAVFDFFTGNMDRHHYETFKVFGNNTFPLLMDNGRGFGKSQQDEMSILAPLFHCCLFRYSTLVRLAVLRSGPRRLSDLLRADLSADRVPNVLTEPHLLALDRRVNIVLRAVLKCVRQKGLRNVVISDGF